MRARREYVAGTGPRGFTLVEVMVVSGLAVLLTTLLGAIWAGFCLPTIDAASRCKIAMEANHAAASFARDLGGSLADPAGRLGGTKDAAFVGRSIPSPGYLRLCYHGGTGTDMTPSWAAPDSVISYQLQGQNLVRTDEIANTAVVVATGVTAFDAEPLSSANGVSLTLTFTVRNLSLTYTLVALDPPAP
jgi:prepilin-type N-terminal cleavage/methylation domain-containing protein